MTSVLIVDDQGMIRAGLRSVLEVSGIDVVGEASNASDGVRLARLLRPDVLLMDLRMPGCSGTEATRHIRANQELAATRVLVLTTFDGENDVLAALAAGADGFIGKAAGPEELVEAVRATGSGESVLSPRASRAVVDHLARTAATSAPGPSPEQERRIASLTPRERTMVEAAATGADNAEIARSLHISPLTVKTHLNRAMVKLEVRDRGQLVAFAFRARLIEP